MAQRGCFDGGKGDATDLESMTSDRQQTTTVTNQSTPEQAAALPALARVRWGCVLAGLLGLTLVAWGGSLNGYFLSDDVMIGAMYADGRHVDWRHVAATFCKDWRGLDVSAAYYRPLVIVSQAIDLSIWGLTPFGFHLTNVLLHALNAFLLFVLGRRLTRRNDIALACSTLFAVLPLHPESVAWISGRTDLLYTAPALTSMWSYVVFRQQARPRFLLIACLTYGAALLTKENAIAVPMMIVVYDVMSGRRPGVLSRARHAVPWLAFAIITMGYLLLRRAALGSVVGGRGAEFFQFDMGAFARVARDLGRIFAAFVFPFNRTLIEGRAAWYRLSVVPLYALLTLLFVGALLRREVSWRSARLAIGLFFASLAPVYNGITLSPALNNSRMIYLPSAWLCLAVASLLVRRGSRATVVVWCVLLVGFIAILQRNLIPWRHAARTMRAARDAYTRTFGQYEGEVIAELPPVYKGAYMGLYNASVFCRPFVMEPPDRQNSLRFRMVYHRRERSFVVVEDDAAFAPEQFARDLRDGQWLWGLGLQHVDEALLNNCEVRSTSVNGVRFVSTTTDPGLEFDLTTRQTDMPARGRPETVYVKLSAAAGSAAPQFFWTSNVGDGFCEESRIDLRPALHLTSAGVQPRNLDGYALYSARLDVHPRWPGIRHAYKLRLDPLSATGEFAIGFFDLVSAAVAAPSLP